MFLSKQNSTLDSAGSLLVKMDGGSLRFGPFDEGLHVFILRDNQWQEEFTAPQINLVTAAHASRRDLPVNAYLAQVPDAIYKAVKPFLSLQVTVLQLVARVPRAADLLVSSPTLTWFLAGQVHRGHLCFLDIEYMVKNKQKFILGELMEQNISNAQLRFLNRIRPVQYDWKVYQGLESVAKNEALAHDFRHWQCIPLAYLESGFDYPWIASMEGARNAFKQSHTGHQINETATKIASWYRDTDRLGASIAIEPQERYRQMARCKSIEALDHLHGKWLKQFRSVEAERKFKGAPPFPRPPLRGNGKDIFPIESPRELYLEGDEMNHCVFTRRKEVYSRKAYLYKVLQPERATLEILIEGRTCKLGEFRLVNNGAPSQESWNHVIQWLGERKRASLK